MKISNFFKYSLNAFKSIWLFCLRYILKTFQNSNLIESNKRMDDILFLQESDNKYIIKYVDQIVFENESKLFLITKYYQVNF